MKRRIVPIKFLALLAFVMEAPIFVAPVSAQQPGSSWKRVSAPNGSIVNQLFVEPNHRMYAQTDYQFYTTSLPLGGSGWDSVTNTLPQVMFGTSIGMSLSGNVLIGTSNLRTYRYEGATNQWTYSTVNPDGTNAENIFALFADTLDHLLFAGTDGAIFESHDDGVSWQGSDIQSPGQEETYCFLQLADGRILAGGYDKILVYDDQNFLWKNLDTLSKPTYVRALCQTPSGAILVGTSPFGYCRSTDNGATWSKLDTTLMGANIRAFTQIDPTEIIAGTLNNGVWKSTDEGATWSQLNAGNQPDSIYSLSMLSNGTLFATTFGSGLYRSTNKGVSWSRVSSMSANDVYRSMVHNDTIFVTTHTISYMSADGGESWIPIFPSEPMSPSGFALVPQTGTLLGTFGGLDNDSTLFRSTDHGATWSSISVPVSSHIYYIGGIEPHSNGNIYLNMQVNSVDSESVVFLRSTDDGLTWASIAELHGTLCVNFALDSAGNIFVTYLNPNGFYKIEKIAIADSINFPISFQSSQPDIWLFMRSDTEIFAGLYGTHVGYFDATPSRSGTNDSGIFSITHIPCIERTPDGSLFVAAIYPYTGPPRYVLQLKQDSTQWHDSDTNFNHPVNTLRYGGDGYLYAGTQDSGIWQYKIENVDAVQDHSSSANATISVYPNPVFDRTTIKFFCPEACHVEILVHNILGTELAHVLDRNVEPGNNIVSWEKPQDLRSGMYECVVRMNGNVESLPIIIEP